MKPFKLTRRTNGRSLGALNTSPLIRIPADHRGRILVAAITEPCVHGHPTLERQIPREIVKRRVFALASKLCAFVQLHPASLHRPAGISWAMCGCRGSDLIHRPMCIKAWMPRSEPFRCPRISTALTRRDQRQTSSSARVRIHSPSRFNAAVGFQRRTDGKRVNEAFWPSHPPARSPM